jgi:REP element-mobilizing transposase RayT
LITTRLDVIFERKGVIMGNRKLSLYVHLIWGTWDGERWIIPGLERRIYCCIVNQIQKLGCEVLAINGVSDHVHLVVKLKSTATIAQLVKKAKGVSARYINQYLRPNESFKWKAGYGGFTISRWDLEKIINYVKNQKIHHGEESLEEELEIL